MQYIYLDVMRSIIPWFDTLIDILNFGISFTFMYKVRKYLYVDALFISLWKKWKDKVC